MSNSTAAVLQLHSSLKTEKRPRVKKPVPVIYHKWNELLIREKNGRFYAVHPRRFSLREASTGKWTLSHYDSRGEYRRLTINGPDCLTAALERAWPIVNGEVVHESTAAFNPLTQPLDEVFEQWLKTLSIRPHTRRDYSKYILILLRYCEFEGVEFLGQLTRARIEAYVQYLRDEREASQNTQRLYLVPVKAMLAWQRLSYPEHFPVNICQGIRTRAANPKRLQRVPLTLKEGLRFLDWLKRHYPDLRPLAAMQLFAGLRVTEAFRLDLCQVDFEKGTVCVEGEVKNAASVRILPVVDIALNALRGLRVKRLGDLHSSLEGYSAQLKRALDMFGRYDLVPMTLRKTIETSALVEWGGPLDLLNRYCGRVPSDIQARHYTVVTQDQWVDLFRAQIVEPLNRKLQELQQAD